MSAVGIIPARYPSSRFPGKPLTSIAGVPMVRRVWEGAIAAKQLRTVIVATDDERIAECCRGFGAEVAMTRSDHRTGTDRIAEVAVNLSDEIVVNIQGDEPLIEGWVIDAAIDALREDPRVDMATLVHAAAAHAVDDPNRVKVVFDRRGHALYFSRSAIPNAAREDPATSFWQHVGLYAYRRPFLLEFVELEQTPGERSERLEQLRALEHGHAIRCAVIDGWQSVSVDVPDDVRRVETALRQADRC